jgi:hypothetical protein
MKKRSYGWWLLAEDLCAHLTMPPTDVVASDRQFERLLRGSRSWSFAGSLAGKIRVAWLDSRLRSWTRRLKSDWPSESDVALNTVAWVMRVAAVTTLAVQALRPAGFDPLSWAVPVAIGVGSLIPPRIAGRLTRSNRPEKSRAELEKR